MRALVPSVQLSLRDLVEMMAERGLSMAHTTIMRWVQRYTPEFEKRWRRFWPAVRLCQCVSTRHTSRSRGEWCYLYRAVDRAVGQSTSGKLSTRRN